MRRVVSASTTPESAGFGNIPPKAWKCRSGIHTASKPRSSAKRVLWRNRSNLSRSNSAGALAKNNRLNVGHVGEGWLIRSNKKKASRPNCKA